MSSIELQGISKRWGDTVALDAMHLSIAAGSFCVLLGPSGCGKSTTLRIIAGLESSSSGAVVIGGRDVTHLPPAERGIAMVFQNYALFPHLSVAQNIGFGMAVRKVPHDEAQRRIDETASLLGLQGLLQRKPSQLSGGQQQRVALGRALVARAKVCLMDEPLSNLDAQLRTEMRHELRELQQRLGLTVVYVTHDQVEAMSMADQVVLLNQGRLEQAAPARELYAKPATPFVAKFIGTPPMNLLAVEAGHIRGSAILVHANPEGQYAKDLAAVALIGLRPEDVHLGGHIQAEVKSTEYLGADLLLRCSIGSEQLSLRVDGKHSIAVGETIRIGWAHEHAHYFDIHDTRL
jgi:sn-glycerol 3-phosphate transport system ATP-binding protein